MIFGWDLRSVGSPLRQKKIEFTLVVVVLQVIPRQLCDNAGFDATDVLNKLRQKHAMQSGEPSRSHSHELDVLLIF